MLHRTLVSGINYPKSAAAMCTIWLISRIPYTIGYASGEPHKVRFQKCLVVNIVLKSHEAEGNVVPFFNYYPVWYVLPLKHGLKLLSEIVSRFTRGQYLPRCNSLALGLRAS